ncbi:MAG: hypothetical protein HY848_07795 [Betaproteobacteria bacterium]|nr:hypothetical protein [Betaproteobacteria bacterium]
MLSVDVGTIITVTLTVFGVLAAVLTLRHELRMRRHIAAEELALQRQRFEREDRESEARQQWLERQNITLGEMVKPLADKLVASLVADTRWAADALERAKLGPYTKTLFGERSSHFREEKEHVAERFVPMLLRRCRKLIEEDGKRVFLLIDAGTTLYPFFSRLGEQTVRAWEVGDLWFRDGRLVVVTNNLPGVQLLMENGRPNPGNRYSGLALDCHLLPGVPLPVYSAVTGDETEEAIMKIRSNNSGQPIAIISLVTGNWIRIRRTSPRCPIPLARGKGHLKAKQNFVNVADEVYVISPLGKIFASAEREVVNKWLGFDSAQIDLEKQTYEELTVTRDDQVRKIALISTSRPNHRILSNLSLYLRGQLGVEAIDEGAFASSPLGEPASILFAFDNLPNEPSLEREVEFPHRHTRRNDFIEFFSNP